MITEDFEEKVEYLRPTRGRGQIPTFNQLKYRNQSLFNIIITAVIMIIIIIMSEKTNHYVKKCSPLDVSLMTVPIREVK